LLVTREITGQILGSEAKNSDQGFRGFTQFHQLNIGILPKNRPRLFSSAS